ncbi:hypothetical protein BGZ95_000472 [Linnemannia exigua]|uniref:Uncharacterized protein n=1 Tax=Linnemannia exigua TaxID=604196 RepID=A0AAD4H4B8_9FUNG|nr:hypothetical protein BGZ95_000472 [Linnemannia exigua]
MEAQAQETSKKVPTSPTSQSNLITDSTDEKTDSSDKAAAISSGTTPTVSTTTTGKPQRNLPGTKDEGLYQWPKRPLESIESAFALREYLQSLIRQDPHNVDLIISLPSGQDENAWLYEHLWYAIISLNNMCLKLDMVYMKMN